MGFRADAQVLWTQDKPASERVPEGVRSVEVVAYTSTKLTPATVLARRTLTGEPAQHLADLVNTLVRDNWGQHGCAMDRGYRKRLTFSTDHGPAVLDGFFCRSVLLSVNGIDQPALVPSQELQAAVDAALGPVPSTAPTG